MDGRRAAHRPARADQRPFRLEFPRGDVVLAEQGDYVVWGRGVDHSWEAEEESVVLTVRWPSVPGYRVP